MKSLETLWILVLLGLTGACSIRDYSNPLLNEYYQGPKISLSSPANGTSQIGSVDVIGTANDPTGVNRVEIVSESGSVTVKNPNDSKSMSFSNKIYFYTQGDKTITIKAYDAKNILSETTLTIHIDIVAPYLFVGTPDKPMIFTNTVSMTFAGTSSIAVGSIAKVEVTRENDGKTFVASGTGAWSTQVEFISNTTNELSIKAISDRGVTNSLPLTVVMDTTRPVLTFVYPTQNQDVPKDFLMHLSAKDTLSPIKGFYYKIDTGAYDYKESYKEVFNGYNNIPNGTHSITAFVKDIAGNITLTQTVVFNVDDSIPSAVVVSPWGVTNDAIPDFTGIASVGSAYTISDVALSINGGAYFTVSQFNSSDWTGWTNFNTALLANQDNTIVTRAIASSGKTNTYEQHVFVDTNPPVFTQVLPASGSVIVNKNTFDYHFEMSESETALAKLVIDVTIGGLTNYSSTNNFSGLNQIEILDGTSSPLDSGGVMTNVLKLYDTAGNVNIQTNIITLLPYVTVATNGNDSWGGFYHQPLRSLPAAVNKAIGLGVTNIVVKCGVYTPGAGLNVGGSENGVKINNANQLHFLGGYDETNGSVIGISVLDGQGSLEHVVWIDSADDIWFNHFVIRGGNANGIPDDGGGMYISNVSNLKLFNVLVTNNVASRNGGGIYAYLNGSAEFDTLLVLNSAGKGGGAYIIANGVQVNGTVAGNSAVNRGGGLYLNGLDNIINASIYLNSADKGGGIYMNGGGNNQIQGTVSSNYADTAGGGVYLDGGVNQKLIAGSKVEWNVSTNNGVSPGYGGGVYINNGSGHSFEGLIDNNIAFHGGGLYADNSTGLIIRGNIEYNGALSNGGGIYCFDLQNSTLAGTVVSNQAQNGGGYYVYLGNNLGIQSTIRDNVAQQNGGGMFLDKGSQAQITGFIDGNLAQSNQGGAMYLSVATNVLIQSSIINNVAQDTGGIYIYKGWQLSLRDSVLTNNEGASQDVILSLKSLADVPTLVISNNIFGGWIGATNTTAIRELVSDTTNHLLMDNTFLTNRLQYLYRDLAALPIDISNVTILNTVANPRHDATRVGGNTVQ